MQNRLNYQPLFWKGARASRSDARDWQKPSLKMESKETMKKSWIHCLHVFI